MSKRKRRATGPLTAAGKAIVSRNAVTHGIHKSLHTLRCENDALLADLEARFAAEYQPHGPTECFLVEELVLCAWRIARIRAVETAGIDLQIDWDAPDIAKLAPAADAPTRTAFSLRRLADTSAFPDLIHRYETRYTRGFDRALRRLELLQRLRNRRREPVDIARENTILQNEHFVRSPTPSDSPEPHSTLEEERGAAA